MQKPLQNVEDLSDTLAVVRSVSTLRAQVVDRLRRAIMEGRLPAGERLIERRLCELLKVSRPLVREGLRQLEVEGWVHNTPYKGMLVASISTEEARELYEIRAALEGLAAQRCAERATAEQSDELSRIVDAMARAQTDRNLDEQVRQVERFYAVILAAAGNKMLSAYLASQRDRLAMLRTLSLSQPGRAFVSIREKRRLVEAIKTRDGAAARAVSEEHLRKAAKAFEAARSGEPRRQASKAKVPARRGNRNGDREQRNDAGH
ncbi:MAG: GntR family transcriptional regulator [Acetobacteraceae bacterium]